MGGGAGVGGDGHVLRLEYPVTNLSIKIEDTFPMY